MRKGWTLAKIGDLLTIQNGFAFDSTNFSDSKGMPLIRIRDLKDGRATETRYSGAFDKRYVVNAGELLIGMDGEFGCYEWRGGNALLNQRVCRLQDFSEKLEPRFLFYGINKYLKEIEDATTYTTVKHLSSKQISNIEIPLPPLPEQQRIVAVLNEAFAGLVTATANAEKNLNNARELFGSYLNAIFAVEGKGWPEKKLSDVCLKIQDGAHHSPKNVYPRNTPNTFPYITSKNVRNNYLDLTKLDFVDREFHDSIYPRCNPELGDVLLTKDGANTGNVTLNTLDEPFSILSSVCLIKTDSRQMTSGFLKYYIQSHHGFEQITGKMTGAAIKRIILQTIKAARVPIPAIAVQEKVVQKLDRVFAETERLSASYQNKLEQLDDLKQSILQKAFSGELTDLPLDTSVVPLRGVDTKTAGFTANILTIAYERHRIAGRDSTFGHKKAQKLLHLVEAVVRVDLGRDPLKDAAGPNDFDHMLRATDWAEKRQIFKFNKSDKRYVFQRLKNYKRGLEEAKRETEKYSKEIGEVIDLLLPMNSEEAEIVATVYAAWNNLIVKSKHVDEEAIVREAREDWHPEKMDIPRHKFFEAIALLRKKKIVPTGQAKLVREKYLI